MKTILLLLALNLGAQHYLSPTIGLTGSSLDKNSSTAVKLPYLGLGYSYKLNEYFSIGSGIEAKGVGYYENSEIKLLSVYANTPLFGSLDLGKGKKVIGLDLGVNGNYRIFTQGYSPKNYFEWLAGVKIGYQGNKAGICLNYRFLNSVKPFNEAALNTNQLGIITSFKL